MPLERLEPSTSRVVRRGRLKGSTVALPTHNPLTGARPQGVAVTGPPPGGPGPIVDKTWNNLLHRLSVFVVPRIPTAMFPPQYEPCTTKGGPRGRLKGSTVAAPPAPLLTRIGRVTLGRRGHTDGSGTPDPSRLSPYFLSLSYSHDQ